MIQGCSVDEVLGQGLLGGKAHLLIKALRDACVR